jgi:hypothetical protein
MGKLKDRTTYNQTHIPWTKGGSGVVGEYVSYGTERTCIAREEPGKDPIGKITYREIKYRKEGSDGDGGDGKHGTIVEQTDVTEIFRFGKRPLAILSAAATTPPAGVARRLGLFNAAVVTGGVMLLPVALAALAVKREWRVGLGERFGRVAATPAGQSAIWIHGASSASSPRWHPSFARFARSFRTSVSSSRA